MEKNEKFRSDILLRLHEFGKKKIKINNSIANLSNKTRSMKLATGETLRQDILHTQTFDFFVAFLDGTLSYSNKSSRAKNCGIAANIC